MGMTKFDEHVEKQLPNDMRVCGDAADCGGDSWNVDGSERTYAMAEERKIKPLTKYDSEQVRAVRKSTGLSQSLFALALGVTPMTVRNWEQGRGEPKGAATRLLDVIQEDASVVEWYVSR